MILTKVFYTYGPNLVILAETGDEFSCGQARDWRTDGRTHRQTQATTIPEGQNWPRVQIIFPHLHLLYQPYLGLRQAPMCSITPETANVDSSHNRMRGPGMGCWFSDPSNCSHWSLTLTFTLTSENLLLYTTLLVLLKLKLKLKHFIGQPWKAALPKYKHIINTQHTHRHERKWNEMKACRRNNNLDIRNAVRAIPVFLSCTPVYWYSRSNLRLCSLICSVGTYVYIYVLVHAYIHMNTHAYIHRSAYTQVAYRDMYTYEGIYIYPMFYNIFQSYI